VVGTLDCVPRVQGSILHLFCNFFLHWIMADSWIYEFHGNMLFHVKWSIHDLSALIKPCFYQNMDRFACIQVNQVYAMLDRCDQALWQPLGSTRRNFHFNMYHRQKDRVQCLRLSLRNLQSRRVRYISLWILKLRCSDFYDEFSV
jgi:hypothetical protein